MKVLYLSHTATVSGGEHSLLDLLAALPAEVEPVLATPAGELAERARERGIRTVAAPRFEPTFRLHPLRTPMAGLELLAAAAAVRRLARRERAELIHANSVRAGLEAALARALGGPPVVVHVRDVLPGGGAAALTRMLLRRLTALALANSQHTARGFLVPPGRTFEVLVVPSPVDLTRFDPAATDRAATRAALGIPPEAFVVAMVAQITPWKNQALAIRALAALLPRVPGARLLIVGSPKFATAATRFDNPGYLRDLEALAAQLGLQERVAFLGERDDVPRLLAAADAALVPSLEEPFGRSVIEAMAMRLPVLATAVGGPTEIIHDGADGFLLLPEAPEIWADRLAALAADPASARRLGEAAARRAGEFGLETHVALVMGGYRIALAGRRRVVGHPPR